MKKKRKESVTYPFTLLAAVEVPKHDESGLDIAEDKEEKVDTISYDNFSPITSKSACKGISEGCKVFFACGKKNPFGTYCTYIKECYTPKCRMAFNCKLFDFKYFLLSSLA